jgi:hypothetical protein
VLPPMSSSAAAGDDEARVGQSEMYGAFFRMLRMVRGRRRPSSPHPCPIRPKR